MKKAKEDRTEAWESSVPAECCDADLRFPGHKLYPRTKGIPPDYAYTPSW